MSQTIDQTTTQGVLELHQKGFGFLRSPQRFYAPQQSDAYVSNELIRKHKLREGAFLCGPVGPAGKGSTGPRLTAIERIEDSEAELFRQSNWDERRRSRRRCR